MTDKERVELFSRAQRRFRELKRLQDAGLEDEADEFLRSESLKSAEFVDAEVTAESAAGGGPAEVQSFRSDPW